MANLKYASSKGTSLLLVAAIVLYAMTALAQNPTDICRPAPVIPLASESPQRRSSSILRWPNRSPPGEW